MSTIATPSWRRTSTGRRRGAPWWSSGAGASRRDNPARPMPPSRRQRRRPAARGEGSSVSVGVAAIEDGAHDAHQVLGFARLRAHHVRRYVVGRVQQVELTRDDHHGHVRQARLLADHAQDLHAVQPGQPQIEEHQVRRLAGELAQRLQPVAGLEHAEPFRPEEGRVHPAGVGVVLDEQHERHANDLRSLWPPRNVDAEGWRAVPLPHAPTRDRLATVLDGDLVTWYQSTKWTTAGAPRWTTKTSSTDSSRRGCAPATSGTGSTSVPRSST